MKFKLLCISTIAALILFGGGCVRKATVDDTKQTLEKAVSRWSESLDKNDMDLLASCVSKTEDLEFFISGNRVVGWSAISKRYQQIFQEQRIVRFAVDNISTHLSGNVGWVSFDWHMETLTPEGAIMLSDGVETQVYRKIEGDWLLVLAHSSIPMPTLGSIP